MDGWGLDRSRSLEPSLHDRGATYALIASCLRVLFLATSADYSARTCSVPNELCCVQQPNQNFARFWSLAATAGTDAVVSNDPVEMAALTESILGSHPPRYREQPRPWPGRLLLRPSVGGFGHLFGAPRAIHSVGQRHFNCCRCSQALPRPQLRRSTAGASSKRVMRWGARDARALTRPCAVGEGWPGAAGSAPLPNHARGVVSHGGWGLPAGRGCGAGICDLKGL